MKAEIDPRWGNSCRSDVCRSHGKLVISSPWGGGTVVGFVLLLLLAIPAVICVALFLRVLDAPLSLGRIIQATALLIAVGAMVIFTFCCFRGRIIMQISRRGLSVRRRIAFLTLSRQHVPLEEIRQINSLEITSEEGISLAVQVQTLGRPISFNCDVSQGEVLRLIGEMRNELAQVQLGMPSWSASPDYIVTRKCAPARQTDEKGTPASQEHFLDRPSTCRWRRRKDPQDIVFENRGRLSFLETGIPTGVCLFVNYGRSASQNRKFHLAWKFATGDVIRVQHRMVKDIEIESSKRRLEHMYNYFWIVRESTGKGTAKIRLVFEDIAFISDDPPVEFHTANDDATKFARSEKPDVMKHQARSLANADITFEVVPNGSTLEIHGADSLSDAQSFTPGDLPGLPSHPVAVGDSWILPLQAGPLRGESTCKLMSVDRIDGRRIARIECVANRKASAGGFPQFVNVQFEPSITSAVLILMPDDFSTKN